MLSSLLGFAHARPESLYRRRSVPHYEPQPRAPVLRHARHSPRRTVSRLESGDASDDAVIGSARLGASEDSRRDAELRVGLGRVLLVGNRPSIKSRGMGGIIDSFDTVVRFNSFVTRGLEERAHGQSDIAVVCMPVDRTQLC